MERSVANPLHALATSVAFMGVRFDAVTTDQTLALIDHMVASRRPHQLITANVDFLVQAQADAELRRILLSSHLVLCDGTPLLWISRWLGNPLPERVAGSDLGPLLVRRAAEKGYRVFFLGSTPEIVAQCAAKVTAAHPDLNVDHYAPPFRRLLEMDHAEILRRVRAAAPDLLLVAFGCPKQEKWIAMHLESLGVPVAIGVGATIDFLAGKVARAPRWMRRTGTEWTFRLLQEPRRLGGRYLKDFFVLGSALGVAARHFRPARGSDPVGRIVCDDTGALTQLALPARLDVTTAGQEASVGAEVMAAGRHCVADLSAVQVIDSTGIAWLSLLWKRLRFAGRHLVLCAPSPVVARALRLTQLDDFLPVVRDAAAARDWVERRLEREAQPVVAGRGRESGTPVAVWRGEITAQNAAAVWAATRAALGSASERIAGIDLSEVNYLDSAGAAVLGQARDLVQEAGGRFRLEGAGRIVRNVLEFAGLASFLESDRGA